MACLASRCPAEPVRPPSEAKWLVPSQKDFTQTTESFIPFKATKLPVKSSKHFLSGVPDTTKAAAFSSTNQSREQFCGEALLFQANLSVASILPFEFRAQETGIDNLRTSHQDWAPS